MRRDLTTRSIILEMIDRFDIGKTCCDGMGMCCKKMMTGWKKCMDYEVEGGRTAPITMHSENKAHCCPMTNPSS